MYTKKLAILTLSSLGGLFLIASYFLFAPPTSDIPSPILLEFTGKIVHLPVEGGFYGIQADDGKKYLPLNLPEALKNTGLTLQDGLPVRITAEKQEQTIGIHLWGEYINIQSIAPN